MVGLAENNWHRNQKWGKISTLLEPFSGRRMGEKIMAHIIVSDFVKQKLEAIKERDQHKSIDSIIRFLLHKAGEA